MKTKTYLILLFSISITFSINAQVDLQNGLVGLYTFEGNANDESNNNNNGQLLGGASANETLRIKDNDIDALSLPNNVVNGFENFSIAYEVKFDGFHTEASGGGQFRTNIVTNGWTTTNTNDVSTEFIKERISDTQTLVNVVSIFIGGVSYKFFNVALNEGIWYQFTFTRENDKLRFYLDGVQIGTEMTVVTTPLDVVQGGFFVGQEQDVLGGNFAQDQSLNGEVDNLYFYNRAINSDEVTAIFNGGLVTNIEDLITVHPEVNIYPNPTNSSDRIFIENKSNKKIVAISLMSIDGKILQSTKEILQSNIIEFELPNTLKINSSVIISIEFEDKFSVSKTIVKN